MQPPTKEARDSAIREYARLMDQNRQMAAAMVDLKERRLVLDKANKVHADYFDALPRVPMSLCPFTGQPLLKAFDPWGLDGFWWQERKLYNLIEPPAPETFRVLRGALNLNDRPPLGGPAEAHVGPGIPYVIPRLLKMPTMLMVVSSLPMLNGYTAYPLAYFSTEVPMASSLVATWRCQTYSFTNSNGAPVWCMPSDVWDFDLKPWVESNKVLWIEPGDPEMSIQRGNWEQYPFKSIQGDMVQQTIVEDRLSTSPPPDGTPYHPFE